MNPTALARAERNSVQELPEVDKTSNSFNTAAFWSDIWQRGDILPDPVTRAGERWLRWYDRHNYNTLWHGAKSGLIKKIGATPYELKGGRNLTNYFDGVLRYAQFGAGFRQMVELLFNDYMVFNGGAYLEIIAPGSPLRPPTGRVTGLAHLDSYMCVPTGNPEYPVVYTDRKGVMHLMHHTRVVHFVDTPDGDQNHPGYGRSALWRAIAICQRQILMGRYIVANLDDKPTPGVMVVGGMTREKWGAIMNLYRDGQATDEGQEFGRVVTVFGVDADHAPKIEVIPFSTPPEAFDRKIYTELDIHELALAIGVDIQELWELTGSNLGSAGQSEVQHAKSQGRTYGEFLATFERAMNNYVLPEALEFEFKVSDPYEAQETASTAKMWADFLAAVGTALTDNEKRQILANQVEAVADAIVDENGELIRLTDADPQAPDQQLPITVDDAAPIDPAAEDNAVALQITKDYDATRSAFVTDFTDLAQAGLADEVSRRRAGTVLRAQIARHGRAAYNDGLKAGGVEDGMSDDDLATVATLIAQQSGYVTDFLNSLYSDGVGNPEAHATMWANKSLQPFFDAGRFSADANGLYEWVLGAAEHCADCLRMSGQKHRLKEYMDSGILPKADRLECGGFNCACTLTRTSGRTKGNWIGGKARGMKFSPSQPRAGDGKWTSEGGALGAALGIGGEGKPARARADRLLDDADIDQAFGDDRELQFAWRSKIEDYTGGGYHAITNAQRMNYDDWYEVTGGSQLEYFQAKSNALMIESGLRKMPVYDGDIYRGLMGDSITDFQGGTLADGEVIQLPALSSFTTNPDVGGDGFGRSGIVLHATKNNSGVNIESLSANRRENEVLVPSNTAYRITRVRERATLPENHPFRDRFGWYVEMEEIT